MVFKGPAGLLISHLVAQLLSQLVSASLPFKDET
jgi:hypothetical protein